MFDISYIYIKKEVFAMDNNVKGDLIQHVFIIGDREIIGSTPKNPVNKRDG